MSEVEGQLALLQETRSYGPVTVTFNRFGRELEATINVPEGYVANVTVRADVFKLGIPPRETKTTTYTFGPGTHTITLSVSELGGIFARFNVVVVPQRVGPGKEEKLIQEIAKAFQKQTEMLSKAIESMQKSITAMQSEIEQSIAAMQSTIQEAFEQGRALSEQEMQQIQQMMQSYMASMSQLQQQVLQLQQQIQQLEQQPKTPGQSTEIEHLANYIQQLINTYNAMIMRLQDQIAALQRQLQELEQRSRTPEQSRQVEELRRQIQQYQQQIAQLQEQVRRLEEELRKARAVPRPTPPKPTPPAVTPPKPKPPVHKPAPPKPTRPTVTTPCSVKVKNLDAHVRDVALDLVVSAYIELDSGCETCDCSVDVYARSLEHMPGKEVHILHCEADRGQKRTCANYNIMYVVKGLPRLHDTIEFYAIVRSRRHRFEKRIVLGKIEVSWPPTPVVETPREVLGKVSVNIEQNRNMVLIHVNNNSNRDVTIYAAIFHLRQRPGYTLQGQVALVPGVRKTLGTVPAKSARTFEVKLPEGDWLLVVGALIEKHKREWKFKIHIPKITPVKPKPPVAPTPPTVTKPRPKPVPTPPKPPSVTIRGKLEVRGTAIETKYPDKLPGTFYAKGWVKVINPNNETKTFTFRPFAQAEIPVAPHEVTWIQIGRYRMYVNGKAVGTSFTDSLPPKTEKQYIVEVYVDVPYNENMQSLQYGVAVDYQYEYWDTHTHTWRKKWDHLIAWAVYVLGNELRRIIERSKPKAAPAKPAPTRPVTRPTKPTRPTVPAKFVITSLPDRVEVEQGQNVKITVSIKNVGGNEGEGLVTLLDEHRIAAAVKEFRLAPDKETTITLVAPVSTPGTFRWQIVVTDKQARHVYDRRFVTVVVKPKTVTPRVTGSVIFEPVKISEDIIIINVINRTNIPVTVSYELRHTPIAGGGPRPARPTTPVMSRLFGLLFGQTTGSFTLQPGQSRTIAIDLRGKEPGKYTILIRAVGGGKEWRYSRSVIRYPTRAPPPRAPSKPVTPTRPPKAPPKTTGNVTCTIEKLDVTKKQAIIRVCNYTNIQANVYVSITPTQPPTVGGGPRPPRPTTPVMTELYGAVTPVGPTEAAKATYGPIPPNKCRTIMHPLRVEAPGYYVLDVVVQAGDKRCELRREFSTGVTVQPVKPRPKPQPVTPTPKPPYEHSGLRGTYTMTCNIEVHYPKVTVVATNKTPAEARLDVYVTDNLGRRIHHGVYSMSANSSREITFNIETVVRASGVPVSPGSSLTVRVVAENNYARCEKATAIAYSPKTTATTPTGPGPKLTCSLYGMYPTSVFAVSNPTPMRAHIEIYVYDVGTGKLLRHIVDDVGTGKTKSITINLDEIYAASGLPLNVGHVARIEASAFNKYSRCEKTAEVTIPPRGISRAL